MELTIVVLSLLPGFGWLFFYLQEDCHPEPRRLLALTFVFGCGSAIVAYLAQEATLYFVFSSLSIQSLSPAGLTVLAGIEELVKFFAAYLVVHKSAEFDEPIDAMIYAVVAALGFATVENLGAIYGNINLDAPAPVSIAFQTASLRFVGATLLHTLTSATVGYYWALDIRSFYERRFLAVGIVLATLLHAIFNFLIITQGGLSYALIFVITIGFFVLSDFEKFRKKTV